MPVVMGLISAGFERMRVMRRFLAALIAVLFAAPALAGTAPNYTPPFGLWRMPADQAYNMPYNLNGVMFDPSTNTPSGRFRCAQRGTRCARASLRPAGQLRRSAGKSTGQFPAFQLAGALQSMVPKQAMSQPAILCRGRHAGRGASLRILRAAQSRQCQDADAGSDPSGRDLCEDAVALSADRDR